MATQTQTPPSSSGNNTGLYYGLALTVGLIVAIVAIALNYQPAAVTNNSLAKADQLIHGMEQAGMKAPDQEAIARVYGTDGGALCKATGGGPLESANVLNTQRGGGEVNLRPGFVDPRVVTYGSLVVQTYCPERTDEYSQLVNDIRTRRTREALP